VLCCDGRRSYAWMMMDGMALGVGLGDDGMGNQKSWRVHEG
jgi:hypothetical protein